MPKYIFSYDEQEKCFPQRYRIIRAGEDGDFLCKNEELTGTVLETEAIEFLEKLMENCQASETLRVELVDAPYWRFIELRFNPEAAEAAASDDTKRRGPGMVT
ncbi:MAG: hypothetical protein ACWA5Q_08280 [bacterium]